VIECAGSGKEAGTISRPSLRTGRSVLLLQRGRIDHGFLEQSVQYGFLDSGAGIEQGLRQRLHGSLFLPEPLRLHSNRLSFSVKGLLVIREPSQHGDGQLRSRIQSHDAILLIGRWCEEVLIAHLRKGRTTIFGRGGKVGQRQTWMPRSLSDMSASTAIALDLASFSDRSR